VDLKLPPSKEFKRVRDRGVKRPLLSEWESLLPDDWEVEAACAHVDPELFFPQGGEKGKTLQAKAVCAQCPVREKCLAKALRNNEEYGVWGGLTATERRRLK
jgi:WhiB family redox-sensing transcriptional regulator